MKTICPSCNTGYSIEDSFFGENVECSTCGKVFEAKAVISPVKENKSKILKVLSLDLFASKQTPVNNEAYFITPVLATLFYVAAVLIGIAAVIIVIGLNLESKRYGVFIFPVIIGSSLSIAVMVGIAQIITAVCETAFNTREMLKIARKK